LKSRYLAFRVPYIGTDKNLTIVVTGNW